MDDTTRLALTYWDLGWSVIPCHVPVANGCSCGRDFCEWPGKHPRVNWTEYTKVRASRDEVRNWFEDEFYQSNVGMATGLVSGIAVVDVDHGAIDTFLGLGLPRTGIIAMSGSGQGVHFYYRMKAPIRSGKPAKNIDLKADGGFIVLPPSVHMSGRRYEWWKMGDVGSLRSDMLPVPENEPGHVYGWADEILSGCYEGDRSTSLARLVGRYAAAGLSTLEASLLLHAWNMQNVHPPLPESEIDRAIRWAYRVHTSDTREIVTSEDLVRIIMKGR